MRAILMKPMEGMVRCAANYVPLSPISFLERSALVYGERFSIVYEDVKYTWRQTHERCIRLASALSESGISRGDVVAAIGPNVPAMYELHFGVPMAGAVLCMLHTRYDVTTIATILRDTEAKIIFVDSEFLAAVEGAFRIISETGGMKLPRVVLISDRNFRSSCGYTGNSTSTISHDLEYENFLALGKLDFKIKRPEDEWDPISVSYTSGTTFSIPKGVIYSHRGACLNALATILVNDMPSRPVYLWSIPLFHCNGWCFSWAIAAQGGTNVFLRDFTAKGIFENIARHQVTHMAGAPTILNMIANAAESDRRPLPGKVAVFSGGSPLPAEVLFRMESLGFDVTHAYGGTETYAPGTVCISKPEWEMLPPNVRAKMKARHGVHHLGLEEVDVKNPETMKSVPWDGKTIGEVMFRGNTIMNGYFKNVKATEAAFRGRYYRIGDVGVRHEDGYIEVKDRVKDMVISGGEYISSVEVESVLFSHPAILEAAVVGRPDKCLGETPCAFVKLKEGHRASEDDIIKYCRDRLPRYMAPQTVVFADLPKTPSGKIQKYLLREKAKALGSLSKNKITSNM